MGLEFTVISAADLKKVRTFSQQQLYYVVAYVDDRMKAASKVAKDGGSNPTWNWKLSFVARGTETITIEIYSHGAFRNKLVGTSKVLMRDVGHLRNSNTPLFLEVRRPSGKVKGVLSVSMEMAPRSPADKRQNSEGHTLAQKPNGAKMGSSPVYPPTTISSSGSVYPPPIAAHSSQVYPPPREASSGFASAPTYPPPTASGVGNRHSSKADEPVTENPTADYAAFQYPPNQYGIRDSPEYYPLAQANEPYNYQQAYYAKPSRTGRKFPGCPPETDGRAGNMRVNSITS